MHSDNKVLNALQSWSGKNEGMGPKKWGLFNPINPNIKIAILIYCAYKSSVQVVGRVY